MSSPLSADRLEVGLRVRSVKHMGGAYPGAMYSIEPGATGTIIAVNANADEPSGEHLCEVKLDQVIDDLFEWGNVLHVYREWGDANLDDFEVIVD